MVRLYEEVVTRLEEMALITTRTLKLNGRMDYAVLFNPLEAGSEPSTVEIVSAEGRSGWYDYRAGACYQTQDLDNETSSGDSQNEN